MADWFSLLVPALSALGGVGLTLGGTARIESNRRRDERRAAYQVSALNTVCDLVVAMTNLARTLSSATQASSGSVSVATGDSAPPDDEVEQMIIRIEEKTTQARLVGPCGMLDLLPLVEKCVAPLHRMARECAANPHETEQLATSARELLRLRDALVDEVRKAQGIA